MKIATEQLIADLKKMVKEDMDYVRSMESLPLSVLNYSQMPIPGAFWKIWNI